MVITNLESLWDRYCCRLLAFLRARVETEEQAEDLLQDVFLRVHRQLCCLPQPEKMDGWIYQIARNLVIDHYRRRRYTDELNDEWGEEFNFEEDPQERLALSIKDLVAALPESYRQAVLLTEYEGLSQVEYARQTGLTLPAAKSRVQRAREKLKNMLLACCHVELDRRGRVIDYYEHCCCCNPGT